MTDQLPPHSIETEQAILGALLLDRDAIAEVVDCLPVEAFYDARHRLIYRAMRWLWSERRPCDLVTLNDTLTGYRKVDEAGGYAYIASLMSVEAMPVHVRHYAGMVLGYAKRRAAIDTAAAVVVAAYRGDLDDDAVIGDFRRAWAPFAPPSTWEVATAAAGLPILRETAMARWSGALIDPVVPSGLFDVDRMTLGGWRAGDLVYLGGRPGSGKTALMLQLAKVAAIATGKTSLIVELEMSREALLNRAVAAEAGVPYAVAYQRVGDLAQRNRWLNASARLEAVPLTVKRLTTTDKVAAEIERAMATDPVGAVFIDHLDLFTDKIATQSTEARTAELSKRCRALTTLGVPVIVLAQLNRAVEAHAPYMPNLSSFKYSGGIEQDADYALLLYRRKYYVERGMLDPDPAADYLPASNRHRVDLNLAKSRNGEVGTINLGWQPESMSFHEVTERNVA